MWCVVTFVHLNLDMCVPTNLSTSIVMQSNLPELKTPHFQSIANVPPPTQKVPKICQICPKMLYMAKIKLLS